MIARDRGVRTFADMETDSLVSATFSFRGHRVRYGVHGVGPPVVLVHGTPWSSYQLRHLLAGLADGYQVFCYDLLGYGASDKPDDDISLSAQGELLAALLASWNLAAPAVVAHDIGGAIALRTHLLHGARYRKLALINVVALTPWGSPFFRHVRTHQEAFTEAPGFIHEAVVRAYIATAAHHPLPTEVLDQTVHPWLGPDGQAAFYRQIAQADEAHTEEIAPRYGEIAMPTRILWGEDDGWIPVDRAHRLAERIPGATVETVAEAGHLIVEEAPGALLASLRPFLAG